MAKSGYVIGALAALLICTNLWWAYHAVDAGITSSYQQVTLDNNKQALAQSLAVIEQAAKQGATRQSIIDAARSSGNNSVIFEKDGYVWVGSIGLRFDSSGRLVSAARAWDPP